MFRGMPILAIRSSTRSLQFPGKRVFRDGTEKHTDTRLTDIATSRLNQLSWPIQLWLDVVSAAADTSWYQYLRLQVLLVLLLLVCQVNTLV